MNKMLTIAIILQLVTGLFLLRAYRHERRAQEMDQMLLNQISESESSD
jgi:preprotein translocase subunit YajC